MENREHGRLIKAAMASRGLDRVTLADATGVKPRTITNWTSGSTMPSDRQRLALRQILGPYDSAGDPVEQAVRRSELVEWRQDAVLSTYKRHLYEQQAGATG